MSMDSLIGSCYLTFGGWVPGREGNAAVFRLPYLTDNRDPFCLVRVHESLWVLQWVQVPTEHRRKGYGSDLLTALCRSADQAGAVVSCHVEDTDDGMRRDALAAWLMRYGFSAPDRDGTMERSPNN